jgi:hypothetical protein
MDAKESTDKRVQNEYIFKGLNQDFVEMVSTFAAQSHLPSSQEADFFCECADINCTKKVRLKLSFYKDVLSHKNRFVILPGHEEHSIEDIVNKQDDYYIVVKR